MQGDGSVGFGYLCALDGIADPLLNQSVRDVLGLLLPRRRWLVRSQYDPHVLSIHTVFA